MKKIILILFIFNLLINAIAQKQPSTGPINPSFLKYKQDLKYKKGNSEEISLGHIPAPNYPVYKNFQKKSSISLPTVYDMRTNGRMTAVRNQGSCGSCWSFAAYGSVESCWKILGLGDNNLSENNLKNCHQFIYGPCEGGNSWMTTAYLTRRTGVISETADPYSATVQACATGKTPIAYITDARFPGADINNIKRVVYEYGALYTAFYYSNSFYRAADFTYYGTINTWANHAVTIAGWDDNKVTAGGTGAWIIKNSWGTGWGQSGYFYISYNDATILQENAFFPTRMDYTINSNVYYYDALGWVLNFGYSTEDCYAVVKYTATDNNPITKAGTWINTEGTTLDIEIYDNFDGTTLSNLLGSVYNKSCEFPGYYTYDLDAPVSMTAGNDFYIKIKYHTPGNNYPIPIETYWEGYSNPVIETGKCWTSGNSTNWDALGADTDYPYDLCIKAYTTGCSLQATITAQSKTNLCQGETVILTANTGNGYTYQWKKNGTNISNATKSSYLANSAGLYVVYITASSNCTATSLPINITISGYPEATITAQGSTVLCAGQSVSLNANAGNGYIYQWHKDGTELTGQTNSIYTSNSTGAYSVRVTNENLCTTTSSAVNIIVNPLPEAPINASGPTAFCDGGSVDLTAITGRDLLYQWKQNGFNIPSATTSSFTALKSGAFTYLITDNNNCTNESNTITVTVYSLPQATVIPVGTTIVCKGTYVPLKAYNETGYKFQWKKNGTNISKATKSIYTATTTGNYSVIVTDANQCKQLSAAETIEIQTASISPTSTVSICDGKTYIFKANSGRGYNYQWQKNETNIPDANKTSFTASEGGAYRVVISSPYCLMTSNETTLNIKALPTAIITPQGATNVCGGNSVRLDANTGEGLTYKWKKGNSYISGATGASYTATATGSYSVVVYSNSCSKISDVENVFIDITAKITPAGPVTICEGKGYTLRTNSGTGLTYKWFKDDILIENATASFYSAKQAGIYQAELSTANKCVSLSNKVTVIVNPLPSSQISASGPVSFCQGGSVNLIATTDIGNSYQWKKSNINITDATDSEYKTESSGAYSVYIKNIYNCAKTSPYQKVTVYTLPVVNLGEDKNITINENILLDAGSSFKSYLWNTGEKTRTININGAALGEGTHNYAVTVSNTYQCKATDDINIIVSPARLTSNNKNNFILGENYPNPFKDETEIVFSLPEQAKVKLEVFNATSIKVADIINDKIYEKGDWQVIFENINLSPGLYTYRLSASGKNNFYTASKFMILIK